MDNGLTVLKQLDHQLLVLKEDGVCLVPKQGWVRTIRKAFGMTIKQLAKRLSVNPSRVVKIEMAEAEKAITLHTLKSVAEALDCVLVYGFIPKTSLEKTVRRQANKVAIEQIKRTSHTMSLEAQSVSEEWLEEQVKDLTSELLRKPWKYLWEEKDV